MFTYTLGSYDAVVFVWDIGGRKGTVYELHGHRQKVTFIRFLPSSNQLMSAGEDGNLVLWDMGVKRAEVIIFLFWNYVDIQTFIFLSSMQYMSVN